jgi:hypothetical protein
MRKYKHLSFTLLIFLIALYFSPILGSFLNYLTENFGVYGVIILGFFYSFSFTGGLGAVMISNIHDNFLIFAFFSAIGAMLADFTILKLIRVSLQKEIDQLLKVFSSLKLFQNFIFQNKKFQAVLAFMIIGSPLPDELGIFLLRKNRVVSQKMFLVFSFIANFVFIYLISRFL